MDINDGGDYLKWLKEFLKNREKYMSKERKVKLIERGDDDILEGEMGDYDLKEK